MSTVTAQLTGSRVRVDWTPVRETLSLFAAVRKASIYSWASSLESLIGCGTGWSNRSASFAKNATSCSKTAARSKNNRPIRPISAVAGRTPTRQAQATWNASTRTGNRTGNRPPALRGAFRDRCRAKAPAYRRTCRMDRRVPAAPKNPRQAIAIACATRRIGAWRSDNHHDDQLPTYGRGCDRSGQRGSCGRDSASATTRCD